MVNATGCLLLGHCQMKCSEVCEVKFYFLSAVGSGCFQGLKVTSSSPEVGWIAIVLSKSALVAPILTATPKPCATQMLGVTPTQEHAA